MTTLHLVAALAAPLVTAVGAVLWAGYVAKGIKDVREINPPRDIRTW